MNYASKGIATAVLLVIVMSVIVALAIFFIMSGQTDWLSQASTYIANLLRIELP